MNMAYNYQSYIDSANKTYADTIKGYQDTLAQTQALQQEHMGKYNTLQSDVLAGIEGTDASQRQAIRDEYARQAQCSKD
jgi:hypothetical protein